MSTGGARFDGRLIKALGIGVFVFLAGYSAAILITEWRTSEDHIRLYLGDIAGDVTFYLINTSLSVLLLAATALIFVVLLQTLAATDGTGSTVGDSLPATRRFRLFLWSQAGMFAFLAFDDRFQVHEKLAARLGDMPDHFVLGAVAILEVVFLALWGPRQLLFEKPGRWFIAGTAAFTVMLGIDAVATEAVWLRLSLEETVKVWGTWFFFVAAWSLWRLALEGLSSPSLAGRSEDSM